MAKACEARGQTRFRLEPLSWSPALKARPGDVVIVLNPAKEVTFKKLVLIDDVSCPKSLNHRFKTRLLVEGVIIGVARGSSVKNSGGASSRHTW